METLVPHVRIGGRYELLERIADDGECSVWHVRDDVLARTVTMRIFLGDVGGLAVDPARAASHVSHPAVLAIYDLGITAEGSFIVTEPHAGRSLVDRIAEGPLDPRNAARVAAQIVGACRAGAAASFEPPLVEPTDVWLDDGDEVKVGFGLRGPAQVPATEQEQVHAIGEVLYLALTATPTGLADPVRSPRSTDPRIPRDLDRITMRALATSDIDPGPDTTGYADLGGFASDLTRIAGDVPAPEPAPSDDEHHSVFRSWMLVPITLVVVTLAVIAGGLILGKLEIGGPLGVRPAPAPSPSAGGRAESSERISEPRELEIRRIRSYDPFGDDTEGESRVSFAIDGSRATAWQSENYFDAVLTKPGMGLLLDLGRPTTVERFRLVTATPGFDYELRVGDDPSELARSRRGGESFEAERVERRDLAEPATGRYALLWITSVAADAGGGHRASVADIELLGRDASS